nr:MAG: putative gag protein [Totiviridae sp.]
MFSNLLALLGDFAKTKINFKAAFGGYSVQRHVAVKVGNSGTVSKRKFLSQDKYTALGDVRVEIVEPVHDPRGYNAEVIDETGDLKPELFVSKARSQGGLSKNAVMSLHADAESYLWDDSQIGLLVALLSTYYTLTAVENKVPANPIHYDDGHVSADLLDQIAEAPADANWWTDEEVNISEWDQRMADEPDVKNILFTTGLTPKHIYVLEKHLSGRNKTTRFAFDLAFPRLTEAAAFTHAPPSPYGNPGEIKAADVLSTINAYVEVNRLHGAFEAAYAIYLQLAVTPIPDTAEGLVWLIRRRYVKLPAFRAHRGLYAFFLRDKPYGLSSATSASWKWWREAGLSAAVQGAQYNAVSLWGRYLVEAGFYHDDAEVHRLGSYEFATSPSAAYFAYGSLITGHDTYCPVPRNVGAGYERWVDGTEISFRVNVADAEMTGYDVYTSADASYLRVTQVPQPCSSVHVMGRMPAEGYFSTLSSDYRLHFERVSDGWELRNVAQAWGAGMALRWLGFDAEMEYRGVRRRANWAPNESSMAARPFSVSGPDRRSVTLTGVYPRARTFANLPPMNDDTFDWDVSFTIDDTYTVSSTTGLRIGTHGSFRPPGDKDMAIIIPDVQSVMYAPVTLRVLSRANVQQAGFRVLVPSTSHNPPDQARPSEQPEPEDQAEPGAEIAA